MVFNVSTVILALFVFIWLVTLSVLVYRMTTHYNRLSRGISKITLKDILDNLLKSQEILKIRESNIEQAIARIEAQDKTHIQKIGIVRYNPFSDTGGSQSFSLALLDDQDNGLVMTSLYARTGNRWYVKEVRKGRGIELELSKEETTAIKRAQVV